MSLTHFGTVPAPLGHAKYDGVAASHSTLVFAPQDSGHVGLLDAATSTFHNVSLPARHVHIRRMYSGAVSAGGHVYFAPHSADHIGIFDVPSRSFSTLPVFNGSPSKYAGAAHVAAVGKLFFGPHNERNVGVLDLEHRTFSTVPLPASVLDHTSQPFARFYGAIASGSHVCFPPYNAEAVLLLDTLTLSLSSVPLTGLATFGDARFRGGATVDGAVYLAPFNAREIGVVHVATRTFESLPIPVVGLAKYAGAAALDGKVYFTPFYQDNVGILDVATRAFTYVPTGPAVRGCLPRLRVALSLSAAGWPAAAPPEAEGSRLASAGRLRGLQVFGRGRARHANLLCAARRGRLWHPLAGAAARAAAAPAAALAAAHHAAGAATAGAANAGAARPTAEPLVGSGHPTEHLFRARVIERAGGPRARMARAPTAQGAHPPPPHRRRHAPAHLPLGACARRPLRRYQTITTIEPHHPWPHHHVLTSPGPRSSSGRRRRHERACRGEPGNESRRPFQSRRRPTLCGSEL
jgi:hypothetical protein